MTTGPLHLMPMFHRPARSTPRRAFTVIELSIAVIIGILLLIGIFTLWHNGNRIFRKADANLEAMQSANFIMAVISDDMRNVTVNVTILQKPEFPYFKVATNGVVSVNPGETPVLLSKRDSSKPFKLPITEPYGANKDTSPERIVKWVEYWLEKQPGANNKDIYHFVRKGPGASGADEQRVFRESYAKDIEFDFLEAACDKPNPTAAPTGDAQRILFARISVLGASTTIMEMGQAGTITTDSDFYRVPVLQLFLLGSVTDIADRRGFGPYWRRVPDVIKGP